MSFVRLVRGVPARPRLQRCVLGPSLTLESFGSLQHGSDYDMNATLGYCRPFYAGSEIMAADQRLGRGRELPALLACAAAGLSISTRVALGFLSGPRLHLSR